MDVWSSPCEISRNFFYLSPPFNFLYPFTYVNDCMHINHVFIACFCLIFGSYMYINYKLLSSVIIYHVYRYIFSLLCNSFLYVLIQWFMVSLKSNFWQSATYVSFCVGSCPERIDEQSFRKMVPQQALNLDSNILLKSNISFQITLYRQPLHYNSILWKLNVRSARILS